MTRLPSVYKARGIPVKSPLCAICVDRTRGKTRERQLTHGVKVFLCEGHDSVEFLRANAGRDFVVRLAAIWRAQGCMTSSRWRALDVHQRACRALGRPTERPQPGSYAWPSIRREAEDAFAAGEPVLSVITRLRSRHALDQAKIPSVRTMRRWFTQCRWLRVPLQA